MGLDMYLNRKIFIWSNQRGQLKITGLKEKVNPENVKYIVEEAGYWRKANAIHKWFVDNVQKGVDDCGDYYVSQDKMRELLDTVNKVLEASELVDGKVVEHYTYNEKGEKVPSLVEGKVIKDPKVANELLPTTSGFFFGGTEYDEYYIADLQNTKEILEKALEDTEGDYEYTSSW